MTKRQLVPALLTIGFLGVGGTLAAAQTKQVPPSTSPPPSAATSAPAKPACTSSGCAHEHAGMAADGKMDCPMMAKGDEGHSMSHLTSLANIKVENTNGGATIQLAAKDPANVQKVQELARELAAHIGSHDEHEHEHGHAGADNKPMH